MCKVFISQDEASLLVSKLIHAEKEDLKKLSQVDREICMKAIECLGLISNCKIEINLSKHKSYKIALDHIQKTLDLETAPKQLSIIDNIIKKISSAVKGVCNFFHLRVSSDQLEKKIDSINSFFLANYWDLYLKDYCKIASNDSLDKINIFFLGDIHIDPLSKKIQDNVIAHYAHHEGFGENLVLLEGLEQGKTADIFPKQLGKKKFKVEGWEDAEHHKQHLDNFNESIMISRELWKWKNNGNDKVSTEGVLDWGKRFDLNLQKCERFKKVRDQDLVNTVKKMHAIDANQKIFGIAGSEHVGEKNAFIKNLSNDHLIAIIIPKESKFSKKRGKELLETAAAEGSPEALFKAQRFARSAQKKSSV